MNRNERYIPAQKAPAQQGTRFQEKDAHKKRTQHTAQAPPQRAQGFICITETVESLKKNRDFKEVYNQRRSVANRLLVLYVKKNNLCINRLGISVSRKVGGAVVRNRIKRLIKESYRLDENTVTAGYDMVVVVRKDAACADFWQIKKSLRDLFDKQKMINIC